MEDVITAITTAITSANLWGVVAVLVPLIALVVLFVLGLGFVRRITKGVSKGKLKF